MPIIDKNADLCIFNSDFDILTSIIAKTHIILA
jgi:hypothetical protein